MGGEAMNSSGRRVLVVEDEVMVSWLLEDMLVDLGYEIVGPAARVNQALAMVEAEAIDLAILDVNLNGEKSYPVADALTARGVPFAFSTGYNNLPVCYRDFPMLQKPYDMAALAAVLSKLLTSKSSTE
jgi:CheY-like chemotaxis protein